MNQIINNFKKPMDRKGRSEWYYKEQAILKIAYWNKNDLNYKLLQHPGKNGSSPYQRACDKKAWQQCKKTFLEVYNAPEKDNPFPGVCHYFSGPPDFKKHPWEKNYFDLPGVPHFHFVKLDR